MILTPHTSSGGVRGETTIANFSFAKWGANQLGLGSPSTSSPYTRLSLWAALDKAKHQRGQYITTSADLQSPWLSGEWRVNWDDVYPDARYSVLVGVDDSTFSYSSPAVVVQAVNVLRSPAYVSGQLYFPLGQVSLGRTFVINVLGIAD